MSSVLTSLTTSFQNYI